MLDAPLRVMPMPTLSRYMTRNPLTVAPHATMAEAHRVMRENGVRHLPVVDGERVVGLVSVHDLHLLETLPGVKPEEVEVEDAMSTELVVAAESDELADIVERMADARIGSVVVMGEGGLTGIFTSIDALRALADVLRREVP
jgi:acetoin utilization protein AcuB